MDSNGNTILYRIMRSLGGKLLLVSDKNFVVLDVSKNMKAIYDQVKTRVAEEHKPIIATKSYVPWQIYLKRSTVLGAPPLPRQQRTDGTLERDEPS